MSVTFMTGFEIQQAATDNITLTGAAYSAVQVRTGAASVRCNVGSGGSATFTPTTGNFIHFGLYIAALPSSVQRVIVGSSASGCNLRLQSDGLLNYYNGGSLVATAANALTTGQWYWIGFRTTGTSVELIQIDGVDAGAVGTSATAPTTIGCSGTEASSIDIYFDDFIVESAGFLAPSKVDIALPISDNTVTGVTDNNGVTTNIWQCVDNTPPIGVASANEAANPKAGMHFPASTTCNYIANLETYTSLGITTAAEVIAVRGVVRHGEDIATGTKNGSIGAYGNPIHTDTTGGFVFGGDAGAHGAEAGLWTPKFGDLFTLRATLDTIVVANNPTMRLDRVSESRVGCVDFMGLYVAWTPVTVARVPRATPYPQIVPQ